MFFAHVVRMLLMIFRLKIFGRMSCLWVSAAATGSEARSECALSLGAVNYNNLDAETSQSTARPYK